MAKPTPEELNIINTKFAKEPLEADQVFVFSDIMIDNLPTSYKSRIHENLLNKFVLDTQDGIGLLLNHNSRTLPVGRSFDAQLKRDAVDGNSVPTLYGKYYMLSGVQTQGGLSTDDLAKSINAGTLFDTSIGFSAESWTCSICSHDIRDYDNCYHWPGDVYALDRGDGVKEEQMCFVDVGIDGKGQILENSLVYAGASGRASIVKEFSDTISGSNVAKEESTLSKLSVVTQLKNVPMDATVYQYLSRGGAYLMTDTEARNDITKEWSDMQVSKELETKLAETEVKVTEAEGKLSVAETELAEVKTKLAEAEQTLSAKQGEVADFGTKLAEKEAENAELSAKVTELTAKATLADNFRNDLIEETLSAGVRAHGNAFKRDQYAKFMATLSVDEIKEYKDGFESLFSANFDNAKRITEAGELGEKNPTNEPKTRSDFADDNEFREHVGKLAISYAKENNLSVDKATEVLYAQFTKEA